MKNNLLFGFSFFLFISTCFTGVYDFTLTGINGNTQSLSIYQGKKLIVITLPVVINGANEKQLRGLDSLAKAHYPDLRVIAVPAMEDGFTTAKQEQLKSWYSDLLDSTVFVSEGLYTRRTSLDLQHPLFKWLTSSELNETFDIDIAGPMHKCFISTDGRLIAVLKPHTDIASQVINKVLAMQ
jgi:glutathione peroxidase-family protein